MAGNGTASKLFQAVNDGYDSIIDTARAANNRTHRLTTALLEDAQQSQRDSVDLVKKWADAPLDVLGFYGALLDSATKSQSRALEATREFFGELADAQQENRQFFQRMWDANRHAGEAVADAARDALTRASDTFQSAARPTPPAAPPSQGDGRRSRESRTSEATEATEA